MPPFNPAKARLKRGLPKKVSDLVPKNSPATPPKIPPKAPPEAFGNEPFAFSEKVAVAAPPIAEPSLPGIVSSRGQPA